MPPTDAGAAARYDMGPLLGRGGMGEVRLARDTRIDREVAVKLMRSELQDATNIARFFREARVQGALEHPAVVPVHDLGVDDSGNPYFVMKRLAGRTLADVLARPDAEHTRGWLLNRFTDVCLAVEFAHQRGVVHRDLKPANIMLGDFGEAYVLDWGLARIGDDQQIRHVSPLQGEDADGTKTGAGELLGTPGYMAPEQARGEVVSTAADVFSLGTVLFEILAGAPALPGGLAAIAHTLAASEHRPSARADVERDIPPELDDACAAATADDPRARPTARELADRVRAYLDGDRDIEQRRALAGVHSARALALAGEMRISELAESARSEAMREAGRALVLDPSNADAQRVLSRLLLEPPRVLPAEAAESVECERVHALQQVVRGAILPYVAVTAGFAMCFLFPVHHAWPLLLGMALTVGGAYFLFVISRRPLRTDSPIYVVFALFNLGILGVGAMILGPLFLVPVFAIGSLTATLSQPVPFNRALLVVLHALPLALDIVLELAGVLPRTFHLVDDAVVLKPWVFDLTPLAALVIFGVGMAVQFINSAVVILVQRRAQEAAQIRVHAVAWQLRQLDPSAQTSASPTGRAATRASL